jgi:hypothetical protein
VIGMDEGVNGRWLGSAGVNVRSGRCDGGHRWVWETDAHWSQGGGAVTVTVTVWFGQVLTQWHECGGR